MSSLLSFRLYLDGNHISTIPYGITNIASLNWLYLENNPILQAALPELPTDTIIPPQAADIPSLKCLTAEVIFKRKIKYPIQ